MNIQPVTNMTKKPGEKPAKTTGQADKTKLLAISCAALCAITVGTVAWASINVSGAAGEIAQVKASTKPAVVATADIPSGTVVEAGAVRVIDVPETYLADNAAFDLETVIGKTTTANIAANAQVTQSNLAGEGNAASLAEAVEPGLVAASVAVNSETGVAGLVRQGDRVDVLAEGGAVIQKARVLALDAQLAGDTAQYSTVTLEVTARQAGDLQAAQMDGAVRLVLNSSVADGSKEA